MNGIVKDGQGASLSGPYRGVVLAAAALPLLALLVGVLVHVLPDIVGARAELPRLGVQVAVQVGGLLLAGCIFVCIWQILLPRFKRHDAARAAAQRGLENILQTVDKGLFVLDAACCLDARHSASLARLLNRPLKAGDDFRQILSDLLPAERMELVTLYLRLLLAGRTREKLMRDLNPLRELAIETPRGVRYLGFEFQRLRNEDGSLSLLACASDVTEAVRLRAELDSARKQADEQWNVMLRLVQVQPASLLDFIEESSVSLIEVNERFKSATGRIAEYRVAVSHLFRVAHSIKSNATALGLDFVAKEASAFEDQLDRMRGEDAYGPAELAVVTVLIQKLFEHMGWLRNVAKRYAEQPASARAPAQVDFQSAVVELARRVASDQSKTVQTRVRLDELERLPGAAASAVRLIAAQLVRNAVAHGIEAPEERKGSGKPEVGQVVVQLEAASPAQYVLRVRDDGRGLCAARLRQALLTQGLKSEAELAELSDQQVVMQIFKRGFTTADTVDAHAGRGVGLDVVNHAVKRIGGRVRLQTQAGQYTEFRVEFAA